MFTTLPQLVHMIICEQWNCESAISFTTYNSSHRQVMAKIVEFVVAIDILIEKCIQFTYVCLKMTHNGVNLEIFYNNHVNLY